MISSKNILNLKSLEEEISETKTGRSPRTVLVIVLLSLVLASSATAFYFWSKTKNAQANPQKTAQNEVENLVSRVGELIVLPLGEEPTVATVTDPEQLKEEAFFANAKQGYKVLIYTKARKAILYDPAQHKVIEVAPLNIGKE